jgi:hypothetical protein
MKLFVFLHLFNSINFQFSQMLEGAPVDPKGNLDYAAFTRQIKRGKEDE